MRAEQNWITTRCWGWVGTRARRKSRKLFGDWRWTFTPTSTLVPPRTWKTEPPSDSSRSPRPTRSSATIASEPITISDLDSPLRVREMVISMVVMVIGAMAMAIVIGAMAADLELVLPPMAADLFLRLRMCFAFSPRALSFSMPSSQGMILSSPWDFI